MESFCADWLGYGAFVCNVGKLPTRVPFKGSDTIEIRLHKSILSELGYDIATNVTILDFGCGDGNRVKDYRNAGFNAFGVDINMAVPTEYLRLIDTSNGYRIPFADGTFDFIFSESVFEHVQNYSEALAEIWRVLKPGGVSLHFLPAKWSPIEPHVFVPFGGVLQNYPWLLLWAFLGVRNRFQKGQHFTEVAVRNYEYLKNRTHYLSRDKIYKHILTYFPDVISAEQYMIKHSPGRARYLKQLIRVCPFVVSFYRSLHWRVIFFTK